MPNAIRTIICLAALPLAAQPAPPAAPGTSRAVAYRVVSYMNHLIGPGLLVEGPPGTFYGTAAHQVFTITAQGVKQVLTTFTGRNPPNILTGLVAGANGRLYSAAEVNPNPTNVFSVDGSPGRRMYAGQTYGPGFAQNPSAQRY
jgi:hypothetical protein